MRRRFTAALAWMAVAASVAVFPLPLVVAERIPPEVHAAAARLDHLTRSLTGNIGERRASERISHHRLQSGIATCMRAAGLRYTWAPLRSFYDGFTDADLGFGDGRAEIADSLTAHGRRHVLNELSYARLEAAPAHTVRPADKGTYRRCRNALRSPPHHGPPPGSQLAAFEGLLGPAYRDPRVLIAWGRLPAVHATAVRI